MSNLLPTDYQSFIHQSRYAKYVDGKGRESWAETVGRYMDNVVRPKLGNDSWSNEIEQAILSLDVMPSMRAMMTSGPALDRDNTAGYNCSYLPVDDPKSFDEAMFILLCGTGVGFSVERQFVSKLPEVAEEFHSSDSVIPVPDSKMGWAKALKELIGMLYVGQIPKWDMSKVRPAGAPLKTFGGRASGPEPLESLFEFCVQIFQAAAGVPESESGSESASHEDSRSGPALPSPQLRLSAAPLWKPYHPHSWPLELLPPNTNFV